MTSKEAIDLIATNCAMNCKKPFNEKCSENCEVLKAFQVVKKDLEVLDIVKKYFVQIFKLDDFTREHLYRIIFKNRVQTLQLTDTELTENEYLLLKEWLENDK